LLLSNLAQVAKPVVKAVAIDVVKCLGNVAVSQKPRKLVTSHSLAADTYLQISTIDNANCVTSLFWARCF
jgi:hypothetical protein